MGKKKRPNRRSPKPKKIKVFISWSGPKAQQLADQLKKCLPTIIPSVDTFFSPKISGGKLWQSTLTKALRTAHFGIICVTKESQSTAWLNFEAGAIWGTPSAATRVFPLLLDLTPSEVDGPIALFQAKQFDEAGMKELCETLAHKARYKSAQLQTSFELVWPRLKENVSGSVLSPK